MKNIPKAGSAKYVHIGNQAGRPVSKNLHVVATSMKSCDHQKKGCTQAAYYMLRFKFFFTLKTLKGDVEREKKGTIVANYRVLTVTAAPARPAFGRVASN